MRGSESRRLLSLTIGLLAAVNATACTGTRPPPPAFERIAIVAEVAKDEEGKLEGDLHADTAVKGALTRGGAGLITGGVGGAVVGAVVGTGCGPFAPFCSAVNTVVFGVFGGVGGLLIGSVGGGISGLGWSTAGEVNRILDRVEASHDFQAELQTAITAAVPAEKQVAEDQAQAIVTARIDKFDLRQHFSSRLSMRVYGSMTQSWGGEEKVCKYSYWTPEQDVEDWVLDDGAPFDEAFSQSVTVMAGWMARDLEAFSTRQAQAETDEFPATCYQP